MPFQMQITIREAIDNIHNIRKLSRMGPIG